MYKNIFFGEKFQKIRKFKKSHKGTFSENKKTPKNHENQKNNRQKHAAQCPENTRALKNTGKKPEEYRKKHPSTQKHLEKNRERTEKNREITEKTPGFPHPACGNVENLTIHLSFYEVHLSFLRRFLPEKVRSFQKFGDFGADYASFIYEALILSQQRHIQASPCRKGHDSISALRSSEPRLYGRFSISERGKACPRNTFSALRRPDLSE